MPGNGPAATGLPEPSGDGAARKGFWHSARAWVITLVVGALGGAITDSLKGTFGGFIPSMRPMLCHLDSGARYLEADRNRINFLVFDLHDDPRGLEADKVAFALQRAGHRAGRSCERFGGGDAGRVMPGPLRSGDLANLDGPQGARARARAREVNATVAIHGALLSDGHARLTVLTPMPSGSFVADVPLKEADWLDKSRLFERMATLPPPPGFPGVNAALGDHLNALMREERVGARRAALAEAHVDVLHRLQQAALPGYPPMGSVRFAQGRPVTLDDSAFWIAMAEGVGYLAGLTRRYDHHLVALSYQAWMFRFAQGPVVSTAEGRRDHAARLRWLLGAGNIPPATGMRLQALRLCAPPEYRAEIFGDASETAPAFLRAREEFERFSAQPDFTQVSQAAAACRFTPAAGFFPRWPPWREPWPGGRQPPILISPTFR